MTTQNKNEQMFNEWIESIIQRNVDKMVEASDGYSVADEDYEALYEGGEIESSEWMLTFNVRTFYDYCPGDDLTPEYWSVNTIEIKGELHIFESDYTHQFEGEALTRLERTGNKLKQVGFLKFR